MTQLVGNSLPASVRSASLSRRPGPAGFGAVSLVLPGTLRAAAKPKTF